MPTSSHSGRTNTIVRPVASHLSHRVLPGAAAGAGRLSSAPAALGAYRPALGLITGVAAIGVAVALSGLRRGPDLEAKSAGDLDVADLPAGAPVLQEAGFADDGTAVSG